MKRWLGLTIVCFGLLSCAGTAQAQSDTIQSDNLNTQLDTSIVDSLKFIEIGGEDPRLDSLVRPWLGTRHGLGKQSVDRIDCSGFVQLIILEYLGHRTQRSSADNFKYGDTVSRDSLKPGDVVFFANRKKRIDHSGVWIGNGKFAHTSTSSGVIISTLETDVYWPKRYMGARRYPIKKVEELE